MGGAGPPIAQPMAAVLLHPHFKSLLLSASGDGVLRVWNTAAVGKPLLELRDHAGPLRALVAVGKQYVTGGDDSRLVAMDIKSKEKHVIQVDAAVSALAAPPAAGKDMALLVAAGTSDGMLRPILSVAYMWVRALPWRCSMGGSHARPCARVRSADTPGTAGGGSACGWVGASHVAGVSGRPRAQRSSPCPPAREG
jgi:hypothetical protein